MATIEVLQALQEEVGSRRAGTAGESEAQTWLKARCKALGLPVELDEFTFIGSEWYRPTLQLLFALIVITSIGLSLFDLPWVGGAGVLLAFFLFFHARKKWEVRLAKTPSRNIIAGLQRPFSEYIGDQDKGPAVLLCAHYDTPRNMPSWSGYLRNAQRTLGPLALLGLLLFAGGLIIAGLGALIETLGLEGARESTATIASTLGWVALVLAAPTLLMMTVFSLFALLRKKSDSPGADDNGSGTALVLDLARRLHEDPPTNLEVFFAWWGAEEYGLFGSRQFVRRFHRKLDREKLHVINADCVGVGDTLTVHTGQGVFFRRKTEPGTVERIERLASRLGIRTIRTWESIISGGSSDHAEWVDRGFRQAISVLRENYRPMSLPARLLATLLRIPDANQLEIRHIHTPEDTISGIKPDILEVTTDLVEAYVRDLE